MLSAWKKEVCAGSRPVGPFGIVQLHGAMTPAFAAAGFWNWLMISSSTSSSPMVKMKPRLPFIIGMMDSHSGWEP